MSRVLFKKDPWPIFSLLAIYCSFNLFLSIFINYKIGFEVTILANFINNFLIIPLFLFLEWSGWRKSILSLWGECPNAIHKGIIIVYFFLTLFLFYEILLPLIKKDYEKNR